MLMIEYRWSAEEEDGDVDGGRKVEVVVMTMGGDARGSRSRAGLSSKAMTALAHQLSCRGL